MRFVSFVSFYSCFKISRVPYYRSPPPFGIIDTMKNRPNPLVRPLLLLSTALAYCCPLLLLVPYIYRLSNYPQYDLQRPKNSQHNMELFKLCGKVNYFQHDFQSFIWAFGDLIANQYHSISTDLDNTTKTNLLYE